ncbi:MULTISPECIES: nickel/cobalt transporter [Desulfosporosinus]|uniref:Nickel/cobalt efflux system n=1 Tax=Desulfosporosinus nitroreducens TaxID=2018668 RepID=A0ABT8QSA1_9FIRM|nr:MULTISPECIES: sulfite exporter TauE/SafE family protein [Desulfosporosinus]MCO1602487.1 sulfite exporter TauE/SafE family protein [Desulfosporosinus nitroreducens]MCO5386385.1 sulfite exporter TauE/SafE family protein [Desulfosporosinus sp.]MDA8224004.1 sulfite exporter TauE/SafE family protein [Desulfitobacterium hafniense]MDO0824180.1 sulfite exporter TauE/SafE family protein [Desulfosporosinus nitroreducens]
MYTFPAVIGLGALHSLEPGHGKGVITAYLISSGAKMKEAIMIGLISALAHTLSIVLLAVSASTAVKVFVPENLIHWLQLISGIVVIYIGLNIITQRLFSNYEKKQKYHNTVHSHHCDSQCNHNHVKLKTNPSSRFDLFLTGFFTGIVPCPSALAILLAAVSADKIPLGLGLVGAFSIGGAITMVAIALFVVRASHTMKKLEKWQVVNRLALVSSCLIIFLGGAVIFQSINHIGVSAF